MVDVALQAGARKAFLIDEPLAAALGADLPIDGPYGNLIVDIGGGTTEVAVVSQLRTVVSESISVAGDVFNQAICHYLHQSHALRVEELTAERLKIHYGSAAPHPQEDSQTFDVAGLRLETGLTGHVSVQRGELRKH